ncbi:hypothetical protein EON67_08610, partial [archaeon]
MVTYVAVSMPRGKRIAAGGRRHDRTAASASMTAPLSSRNVRPSKPVFVFRVTTSCSTGVLNASRATSSTLEAFVCTFR